MDQKRPRNRVFAPKMHFFAGILFLDHTPLEEIILNEVRLGGSPTIDFARHTRLSWGWTNLIGNWQFTHNLLLQAISVISHNPACVLHQHLSKVQRGVVRSQRKSKGRLCFIPVAVFFSNPHWGCELTHILPGWVCIKYELVNGTGDSISMTSGDLMWSGARQCWWWMMGI